VSQQNSKKTLINWDLVSVNPNEKNWDWKDLFCFWGVNIQSVVGFSLITSLYLIYDLNTLVVLIGSILGSLFVYIFSNLIGQPSQKFGLPFVVLLRSSLGISGAKYFGFLRGLVGIFMFGIQTYFLAKAMGYLVRITIFSIEPTLLDQDIFLTFLIGLNLIDWVSIIIAIIFQTLLFNIGMAFNKKLINFSALVVYFGMIFFFLTILLNDVKLTGETFVNSLSFESLINVNNIGPLLTVAITIFAYFSITILSFGDFSRYVKNEKELKKGNISLLLNLIIFSFFSLFIVIGADVFLKQDPDNLTRIFTNPMDIIGKSDNLLITILVLFIVIIASLSTNLIASFIPSQYTLINLMPSSLSFKSSSFIIAIFSFVISIFWLTFLSQIGILSFVDTFGSFFGPLFGIMIVDFYLINKRKLNNKDIHSIENSSSYYYSGGWHIRGVYSLILGFIFSASTIWNSNLMFAQSYSWIIGALITALTYYLMTKK